MREEEGERGLQAVSECFELFLLIKIGDKCRNAQSRHLNVKILWDECVAHIHLCNALVSKQITLKNDE